MSYDWSDNIHLLRQDIADLEKYNPLGSRGGALSRSIDRLKRTEEHMAQEAITKYINILHAALRDLHAAYPDQRIELRIKEMEPGGWQCYIEFTERDVKIGSESFYINPPDKL